MPYICISILYWCFSFWLTSLCIIGSSFIHLIRTDSNVFILMAEYHSIVYMYHSFLIHSSTDGHLGCFHVLASLSGRFPISSSLVWFGGHLSCSFTCLVFLCLFILFILLCLGWPFCILAVCGVLCIVEFPCCVWV